MADIDDFRRGHLRALVLHLQLPGANLGAIFASQANRLAAALIDQVDDALVHQAAQYHLHDIHGLRVSDSHAIHEAGFDIELLQQAANLRAAAVNHHRINANFLHQHDVASK